MAVKALPHTLVELSQVGSLGPAVLLLILVAPALDLLASALPTVPFAAEATLVTTGAASIILLLTWIRAPRATWIAAAGLASLASLGLRLGQANGAPALALLAILALGLGGAFATSDATLDAVGRPPTAS
jgi:hypothetical protein